MTETIEESTPDLESSKETITISGGRTGGNQAPGATVIGDDTERQKAPFWRSFLSSSTAQSVVAISALFLAVYQFELSMQSERNSRAQQAISQFIEQVTALSTENRSRISGSDDMQVTRATSAHIDNFIASRAQMLIDGDDTGKFAGDILRFLIANEFGYLLSNDVDTPSKHRLNINNSVFVDSKISATEIMKPTIRCVGFQNSNFESLTISEGNLDMVSIEGSVLRTFSINDSKVSNLYVHDSNIYQGFSLRDSVVYNALFEGVSLGRPIHDMASDAFLIYSDFRGLHLGNASNGMARQEDIADLAIALLKAKSLYKSRFDEGVEEYIKNNHAEDYQALFVDAPRFGGGNRNKGAIIGLTDEQLLGIYESNIKEDVGNLLYSEENCGSSTLRDKKISPRGLVARIPLINGS